MSFVFCFYPRYPTKTLLYPSPKPFPATLLNDFITIMHFVSVITTGPNGKSLDEILISLLEEVAGLQREAGEDGLC
jgi:hypothetical protein